jgi:hypothetical protein
MSGWGDNTTSLVFDDDAVARIGHALLAGPRPHPVASRLIGDRESGLRVRLGLALIDLAQRPHERARREAEAARPRLVLIDDALGTWLACAECDMAFWHADDPMIGTRFAAHVPLCGSAS